MQEQELNKSCWAGEQNSTRAAENSNTCPICKNEGIGVKNITVKHLVLDEFVEDIKEYNYFICMNEECNVVYFNPDLGITYSKQQVKVPLWFKKEANPKYVCYCNQVTEKQIINAVLNDGAKDLKDIIKLTGAMKNGKCEINNPLGKCCSPFIQETINKALKIKR